MATRQCVTDASAYYAMNAIWDLTSHRDHFKGRGGGHPDALFTEQDTVVLVSSGLPHDNRVLGIPQEVVCRARCGSPPPPNLPWG